MEEIELLKNLQGLGLAGAFERKGTVWPANKAP